MGVTIHPGPLRYAGKTCRSRRANKTQMETSDETLLARLLGPADPEILCDECFEELDRYVELELAGDGADDGVPGMLAHLEGCPACQEEYESLRLLIADGEARGRD
jgi:hypothetical protein